MTDFDPEAPLNRIKGESRKAHKAFMDYFLAGAAWSLRDLHQEYQNRAIRNEQQDGDEQRDGNEVATEKPPTRSWWTVCNWSKNNHWQARIDRQTEIDNEIALAQYRQRHMTGPEVIARLSDMARADIAEFADVRSPADLEDKLNSHVIKKITVQARRHKDGTITAKTTIELHDAQGALEKLARHHGLFKDRLDITSGDQPFTIDDLTEAAKEIEDWKDENDRDPDSAD
jgi:hypothetical protein